MQAIFRWVVRRTFVSLIPTIIGLYRHLNFFSQGANTPYLGLELQGRVQSVLVDGRCVFERSNGGFSASSR